MKLNCNIDGQFYSLIVDSDKPLSRILSEISPFFPEFNSCRGGNCGNCLVFVNDNLVQSCLVPAFRINGASIQTYDGFARSRSYHDIKKAFDETGTQPCQQCYASKVLIIENIIRKIEKNETSHNNRKSEDKETEEKMISQELSINNCFCSSPEDIAKIVNNALASRRKRNARKS